MHSGGFLTLYNLFQGASSCQPCLLGHSWGTSCSLSFATLLLAFIDTSEPTLLNSLLLTMARCHNLGPLLAEFVDDRITKRRDVFTGVPTPEEPNTPLASLLRQVV